MLPLGQQQFRSARVHQPSGGIIAKEEPAGKVVVSKDGDHHVVPEEEKVVPASGGGNVGPETVAVEWT